jgi:NNP family nitrate/nitrite transporter-like MFS transporter
MANGFAGGWGNSGGGVVYFIMPAVYEAMLKHHTPHWAWRYAFFVPFAMITFVAGLIIVVGHDTPVGKWSDREKAIEARLAAEHASGHLVAHSGLGEARVHGQIPGHMDAKEKEPSETSDVEHGVGQVIDVDSEYTHEVIVKPTFKETIKVLISPQTLALMAMYYNSFGSELAIDAILGAWYIKNFKMSQAGSGRWAAMFGMLNIYGRPLGGILSDIIYRKTGGSLWAKKMWCHFLGIGMGIFMLALGILDSNDKATMMGLMAVLAVSKL